MLDVIAASSSAGGNDPVGMFTMFGGIYFATGATVHLFRITCKAIRRRWTEVKNELDKIDRDFRF